MSAKDAGEPLLCECHHVAMLWRKSNRHRTGGRWRCRIRVREENRASYAANREKRLAKQHAYWFERMSFEVRVGKELRDRHKRALKRMAARHAKRQEET